MFVISKAADRWATAPHDRPRSWSVLDKHPCASATDKEIVVLYTVIFVCILMPILLFVLFICCIFSGL
jgi:hypothetical protein